MVVETGVVLDASPDAAGQGDRVRRRPASSSRPRARPRAGQTARQIRDPQITGQESGKKGRYPHGAKLTAIFWHRPKWNPPEPILWKIPCQSSCPLVPQAVTAAPSLRAAAARKRAAAKLATAVPRRPSGGFFPLISWTSQCGGAEPPSANGVPTSPRPI